MKFLVDARLPPALAAWLRQAGHEAVHVEDVGLRNADDPPIWAHALHNGAIIVTKDEDFKDRVAMATQAPVVVWLRIGNSTKRVLLAWLTPRWPQIIGLINQGHRLIEVV